MPRTLHWLAISQRVSSKVLLSTWRPPEIWSLKAHSRFFFFLSSCPWSLTVGWRHWPCAASSTTARFASASAVPLASNFVPPCVPKACSEVPSQRCLLCPSCPQTTTLPSYIPLAAFVFCNRSSDRLTWYNKLICFCSHLSSLTRIPLLWWQGLHLAVGPPLLVLYQLHRTMQAGDSRESHWMNEWGTERMTPPLHHEIPWSRVFVVFTFAPWNIWSSWRW